MVHHIPPPVGALPPNASSAEYTREFGRRIQAALNEKGWTQSELWRQLKSELGDESKLGRDNVSKWVRGLALPRSVRVREALCRVLDVEMTELFPSRDGRPTTYETFAMTAIDNNLDQVWVTVNKAVPFAVAIEIQKILFLKNEK